MNVELLCSECGVRATVVQKGPQQRHAFTMGYSFKLICENGHYTLLEVFGTSGGKTFLQVSKAGAVRKERSIQAAVQDKLSQGG